MYTIEKNQSLYNKCLNLLQATETPIYFSDAVIVKTSPHNELFRFYAVVLTANKEIKLMGVDEEWHEINTSQTNAGYVLSSLYQRLRLISFQESHACNV